MTMEKPPIFWGYTPFSEQPFGVPRHRFKLTPAESSPFPDKKNRRRPRSFRMISILVGFIRSPNFGPTRIQETEVNQGLNPSESEKKHALFWISQVGRNPSQLSRRNLPLPPFLFFIAAFCKHVTASSWLAPGMEDLGIAEATIRRPTAISRRRWHLNNCWSTRMPWL